MSRVIKFLQHPWDESPKEFKTRAVKPETIIKNHNIPFPIGYEMMVVDGDKMYLLPEAKNIRLKSALVKFILIPKGKMADFFVGLGLVITGVILSFATFGALAPITGGYLIAGGITMMVGSGVRLLLGSKQPNVPSLADNSQKTSYALTGAENQLGIGNPFPVVFGKHRINPPVVGSHFTTQSDNTGTGDQYISMLFALGYKDLLISDIKIGDNELANNALEQMSGYIPTTGSYTADLEVRQGNLPSIYNTKVYEQNIGGKLEYNQSAGVYGWLCKEGSFFTIEHQSTPIMPDGVIIKLIMPAVWGDLYKVISEPNKNRAMPILSNISCETTTINSPAGAVNGGVDINTFTTIDNTKQIIVGIVFQGLVYFNANGGKESMSVPCELWYRPAGSSVKWELGEQSTFTGNKNYIYRWQMSKAFSKQELESNPSGKWEILVCRKIKESTDAKVMNKGIVAYIQSKTNLNPVESDALDKLTYLAVRIKATEAAQAQLRAISCVASSILPVKAGGNWVSEQETANPASIFRALALGKFNNRKLKESDLDNNAIDALYDWCEVNGRTCNAIIGENEPKIDLMNKILSVCQARFMIKNGKISIAHDVEKLNPVDILTSKNSNNFKASRALGGYFNVMDATWTDSGADFKQTNQEVMLRGQIASPDNVTQKIDLFGTTNYGQTYKICRYLLSCAKYRTEQFTVDVGIQQVNIPIGARILVNHDVLKVGIVAGRIKGFGVDIDTELNYIKLDEVISYESLNPELKYGLKVMRSKTSDIIHIPVELNLQNPLSEIVLVKDNPDTYLIDIGDIYAFGELDNETFDCYISNKTPSDNYGATLTLVPYIEAIYTDTEEEAPIYKPKISQGGIGKIPVFDTQDQTASTLTIENQGQVFFDFAQYSIKTDELGDYYFNRGNLRELAKFRNLGINTVELFDEDRSLPINWLEQTGDNNYGFYIDNTMWKSHTIQFMVRNLSVVANVDKKWLFYYKDGLNKNELGLFVENGKLHLIINSFEIYIQQWIDNPKASMISVTTDFINMKLKVWQNIDLILEFNLKDSSIQLIDEPDTNFLISETDEVITGLGTEKENIIKLGADRNILFNLLGNGTDNTGAQFDIADFHLWDMASDTSTIENIYKTGIIPIKVGKVKTYLGEFSLVPQRAKIGDYFNYTGDTTDLFYKGAIYQLLLNGWTRIDSLEI